MPRLSIGLPVYNGASYLAECVASQLESGVPDLELIISDNASTDGTDVIALEIARRDPRVKFVRQSRNLGAAGNFNVVFHMASAPFFKWACADDRAAPGFVAQALAELEAHPEAVLCYGATTLIDATGLTLGASTQDLDLRAPDVIARFRRACGHRGLLHVLQGVWRTDALRGSGLVGAFPGSDETLVAEMSLHGTFRELRDPMLFRRMHPQAASAGQTVAARQEHLDPRTRGRVVMYYWRHAFEHLRGVWRAPLSRGMRVRLAGVVVRSMIQSRDSLGRELVRAVQQIVRRTIGGWAATNRA